MERQTMAHNYAINDDVHHQLQGPQGRAGVKQRSVYTVVSCLPIEADGRPRYRIKSKTENVERVVTEEQLSGSTRPRVLASFSLTMAATTCSCTSVPSSVPAWARSMKARSFHSNRSSTACAARPARKTFAPCDASRSRDFPADVPGSRDRLRGRRHEIKARRLNPAGFFRVDRHCSW